MDKELKARMKEWANSQEAAIFCKEVIAMIEDSRTAATMPYVAKIPVDFINVKRAEAASRAGAFDDILEVIEQLKK